MGSPVADVAEIEPAGGGGVVRFVEREPGEEAFGICRLEPPPARPGSCEPRCPF